MTFEFEVKEVERDYLDKGVVAIQLQGKGDTPYSNRLFLRLRSEDANKMTLGAKFVLTAVDESPESESALLPSAVNLP